MPPAAPRPSDHHPPAWTGELADVRERLARLETRGEAHETASVERHQRVLDVLKEIEDRLDEVERRTWKIAVGLALGAGGAAGGVELVKVLLGA